MLQLQLQLESPGYHISYHTTFARRCLMPSGSAPWAGVHGHMPKWFNIRMECLLARFVSRCDFPLDESRLPVWIRLGQFYAWGAKQALKHYQSLSGEPGEAIVDCRRLKRISEERFWDLRGLETCAI
jgi:hypothetical protein